MPDIRYGNIAFSIEEQHQDTGITLKATVYVAYTFHPEYLGAHDGLGVPIEPDEPEHVEIQRVTVRMRGAEFAVELKPEDYDRADIERRCMEDATS